MMIMMVDAWVPMLIAGNFDPLELALPVQSEAFLTPTLVVMNAMICTLITKFTDTNKKEQ